MEGEVASRLQGDLNRFSEACFAGDGEWDAALRLLLAAASLRPALLAPETTAGFILDSLHLGEGLNRFYDYAQKS